MNESLFGHLAFNFSKSPEDLATEALCYILGKHPSANAALIRSIKLISPNLPDVLFFSTQESGEEMERPDIIGKDKNGIEVFLGESKFWAGLTGNQPVAYLERLKQHDGVILMFIAPQKRIATLWPELLRRCHEADLAYQIDDSTIKYFFTATYPDYPTLALTSWRTLLNTIQSALDAEGDTQALSDLAQLRGLCDRMDEEAFLPIRPEELASSVGTRIIQFSSLINDLINHFANENSISLEGLRATHTRDGYGRYFYLSGFGCMVQYNPLWWSKFRETPIWLSIQNASTNPWSFPEKARTILSRFEVESPSRLIKDGKMLIIPLYLPFGQERQAIFQSLLVQMREILTLLTPQE